MCSTREEEATARTELVEEEELLVLREGVEGEEERGGRKGEEREGRWIRQSRGREMKEKL